jgi:hypothetical protein
MSPNIKRLTYLTTICFIRKFPAFYITFFDTYYCKIPISRLQKLLVKVSSFCLNSFFLPQVGVLASSLDFILELKNKKLFFKKGWDETLSYKNR